ncbi:MAG TPA: hypothetical protein VFV34_23580, partial [Blastocatellia bacterium]|nr:hypothetical protein [Blastocatellia bacterium]
MRKVFVIIKREYMTRVKSKGFVIATVVMPVLMIGFTTLPVILAMKGRTERKLVVLDQSGRPDLFDTVQTIAAGRDNQTRYEMTRVAVESSEDLRALTEKYKDEVRNDTSKAFVMWPPDIMKGGTPEYHAKSATDF